MMSDAVRKIRNNVESYLRPRAPTLCPNGLILELVALSTIESCLNDFATRISVEVTGDHGVTLRDNGRGMRLDPDRGSTISHAEEALTTIYPVHIDHPQLMTALGDWLWQDRGSLGPVVANALSESFVLTSFRQGQRWVQHFECGVARSPAEPQGTTNDSGTEIRLVADRTVFGRAAFDIEALQSKLNELTSVFPKLDLEYHQSGL